jgi:hypothetical protein
MKRRGEGRVGKERMRDEKTDGETKVRGHDLENGLISEWNILEQIHPRKDRT